MNHGISAYRNAAVGRYAATAPAEPAARPAASEAPTVRQLQQARAAASDLSTEETQMIERY
ncbi:MAG: hypothetical protein ACOCTG_04840, partial [Bacteroidota bacterium]